MWARAAAYGGASSRGGSRFSRQSEPWSRRRKPPELAAAGGAERRTARRCTAATCSDAKLKETRREPFSFIEFKIVHIYRVQKIGREERERGYDSDNALLPSEKSYQLSYYKWLNYKDIQQLFLLPTILILTGKYAKKNKKISSSY